VTINIYRKGSVKSYVSVDNMLNRKVKDVVRGNGNREIGRRTKKGTGKGKWKQGKWKQKSKGGSK
jgi:hypothetical protein